MPNRTKWTDRARETFLRVLEETANVSAASRACRMSRSRLYELRREDEAFAEDWQEALETVLDGLEGEARRRAMGWDEPVYDKDGEIIGHVLRYSDRMMELLLKAHRPEKYRDRPRPQYVGSDGEPVKPIINITFDPPP